MRFAPYGDVPGISKRLPFLVPSRYCTFRACVRASWVTTASLYSCYIARLPRTSICRADTRRMTKSRTVDPESRFSLSTTHARVARVLGASRRLRLHIFLPCGRTRKPFSIASVRVIASARIHPRFQGMFQGRCRTSIIP